MTQLERLVEYKRIELGLTRYDYAVKELKMSYTTFAKIMAGNDNIRIENVNKLAKSLNISNQQVLDLIKEK